MPEGTEFIKHEFDESIAITQCIIESAEKLRSAHPVAEVRTALRTSVSNAKRHLKELQRYGKPFGATGEKEEVAEGMTSLMEETLEKATSSGEESDFYEAHAVLLSLERKQLDSAPAVAKVARDRGNRELVAAALAMEKDLKASSKELSRSLAEFAVQIAEESEEDEEEGQEEAE